MTLTAYSAMMVPHRWKEVMEWFDTLRDRLIEAYAEYESFWKRANWRAEEDIGFMARVRDHQKMRLHLRHQNISQPRDLDGNMLQLPPSDHYDAAELACAHSLYLILWLQQSPCKKKALDARLKQLELQLTRYTAASLIDCDQRHGTFASGKVKGAIGPLRELIIKIIGEHGLVDSETLWSHLREDAAGSTKGKRDSLRVEEITEADGVDQACMTYRSENQEYDVQKRTVQNVLYSTYKSIDYEPLAYLEKIFLKDPPMSFAAFWRAIQAECREPALSGYKKTRLLSADDQELTYRFGDKEYCVSKEIIWNRFRTFKKKNN
jgi:transcriptional antiterminator Rof (Rho-off)